MPDVYGQKGFGKGIQADTGLLKQPTNGYKLFINGRARYNELRAIRKPVYNNGTPAGLKQGLYSVDEYLIIFIAGAAYVTSVRGKTAEQLIWQQVAGFVMSETEEEIHFVIVPASSINFERDFNNGIGFTTSLIASSNAAGVAFDGVTQPYVIYPYNGSVEARITQNYAEWTPGSTNVDDSREYVPIGKFPLYASPRLYMVGKDKRGLYTQILRSVSGRPLDFMVNIDSNTGLANGTADTVSHSFSGDPITGLYGLPTPDGSFLASTLKSVYNIIPIDNVENRIFNEPVFRHRPSLPVGLIGHHVLADINGDTALISQSGIHSYNSVMDLQTESNNEPFSKSILPYINKPLTYGAATNFDDYALFALDTVFGPGIAVYDITTDSFPAIDLHRNLGRVKQFAVTKYSGQQRCFAITADNRFCELYAHPTEIETPRFYFGDFTTESATKHLSNQAVGILLSDVVGDTNVSARHFVNGVETEQSTRLLRANEDTSSSYPRLVPHNDTGSPQHKTVRFENVLARQGMSCGWEISWDSPVAAITHLILECDVESAIANLDQQTDANTQIHVTDGSLLKFAAVGDTGPFALSGQAYSAVIRQITTFKPHTVIGLGDHIYEASTEEQYMASFGPGIWPASTRFKLAAGNHDLDGPAFKAHFGSQLYYSYRVGHVEWFILNAGYDASSVGLVGAGRINQAPTKEPDGNTATSKQARWLKTSLAASTARFKLVVVHTPPKTSNANYYPGYTNLDWPLKLWGADALFSGHAHNYERIIVDGFPYIICGTGGRSLVGFDQYYVAPGSQFRKANMFGFLRVTAYATTLVTQFNTIDGTLHDKFQILG